MLNVPTFHLTGIVQSITRRHNIDKNINVSNVYIHVQLYHDTIQHNGSYMSSRNCVSFRSIWVHSDFWWGSCCSICSFLCNALLLVVCPFVLFLLAIVSSVLLQLSASDYFVGIFKRCLVLVVFEQVSPQVVYWIFTLIFHRIMNRNWLPCVLNE